MTYQQIKLVGGILLAIPLAWRQSDLVLEQLISRAYMLVVAATTESPQARKVDRLASYGPDFDELHQVEVLTLFEFSRRLDEERAAKRKVWYDESLRLFERAQRFDSGPPMFDGRRE